MVARPSLTWRAPSNGELENKESTVMLSYPLKQRQSCFKTVLPTTGALGCQSHLLYPDRMLLPKL